jgi:N-methylhydantoinase B
VCFSGVKLKDGDKFWRCSSGGGGYGDPLERDPGAVLEDIKDEYVSIERAKKDYGVVIDAIDEEACEYAIDQAATSKEREFILAHRKLWLEEDPDKVRAMVAEGQIAPLDAVRRYGVILDRRSTEVLRETTRVFRDAYRASIAGYW